MMPGMVYGCFGLVLDQKVVLGRVPFDCLAGAGL